MTASPIPLLQTTTIAKSYGPVVALRTVQLTVAPGEVHALLGANGAGKSTLVKILTGVVRPDSGQIRVDGEVVTLSSPARARRHGLAPVFQDPALVADLTVRENLRLTGADESAVRAELETMGLGGLDLGEQVREVPLPFLRMLDLARAISFDPKVLLLDEITAALPPDLSDVVFDVMRRWRDRGRAVLFISHRLAEVRAHCDMCTVLRDGREVASFDPRAGGESQIVAAMLGDTAAVVSEGNPRVPRVEQAAVPRLAAASLAVGRALENVSLDVRAGEVLGVVALEGQGQDVLFDTLCGNRRPDGGTLTVDGEVVRARHPFDAVRRGIVLVPSDRLLALLPQRPIRENIAAPLYNRVRSWGPLNLRRERGSVERAVTRLQIDTRAAAQAKRLSGGNQQKLTIARWLASGFRTLLLFDPTRGIDVGTKHQIYDLIRELADGGAAIVMFTSELREVALVCDRVIVLHGGRVVAQLPPDTTESELLHAMHGLEVRA